MLIINREVYDLILFDFDGVLFDTNAVKTEGFRFALQGYPPDSVDRFIDFHKTNGGISRYEKLTYFFEVIMGGKVRSNNQAAALSLFGNYVTENIVHAQILPGVQRFLNSCARKKIPLAICSAGNQMDIIYLLKKHQLTELFCSIWHNDHSKEAHIARHIEGKYPNVLYFGDGKHDLKLAHKYGFEFIFVAGASEWRDGEENAHSHGYPAIKTFLELAD